MRGFLQRNAFLLRFALLSSFMGISVGLAKFTTTLYALHLGAQGGWLAAIAGAQSIGILFMSIPVGFWVERLGPVRLFVGGSLFIAALYATIPLLPHPLFLLVLTALVSFLMPLRFVSLSIVFMAALEHIGHARAGWQRGAHMAGMFLLGPMLAAGVVAVLGHAGSYWLIAALFVLTAALSSSVFSQHAEAPPRADTVRLSMRQSVQALWREPEVRALAMQECAIQAIHMYYAFYMVVIAVQELGLPALGAGALVAVQGSAFVATLIFLGPLLTWLGPLRTVLWAVGSVITAALLLAWANSAVWLWVGGAVLGGGLGLLQMHTLTQFAHVGARLGRGRVSGLSALAGPCGGFVGGLLGGTLGAVVGLQAVFLLFVPVFGWLGWRAFRESTRPAMFLI
jgi:Na+/melibiose symporter-like transporter